MRWTLGIGGALAGLVGTGALILSLCMYSPHMPGRYEMLVQLAIAGLVSGTLGVIGFSIGCVVDLCAARRRKMQDR